MEYDCGDSFIFESNGIPFGSKGIPFGSKGKEKQSPRSYSFQFESNQKTITSLCATFTVI